ncbi:MAG: DUF1624 domain-containing protein [Cyclobacteriaceae bacterium]|nr:DUF1624 domain-containing protein [Cyclobacteriaceae bacterium]
MDPDETRGYRIQSIDLLRGVVMVLMAIDHSRAFLHEDFNVFNAEDLARTSPILFFTRWVTHFCAPVFIFLVGASAYLMESKMRSKKNLSIFLFSRGAFLILLELTIFRFCWQPQAHFFQPFILLLVIWAIGVSMIYLAGIIHLSNGVILGSGLIILFFHNTLSSIAFPPGGAISVFWTFFYAGGYNQLTENIGVVFLYSVLPYFGLVALGYSFGQLYTSAFDITRRRQFLIGLGVSCILLFIVLRYYNLYGDPSPWSTGKDTIFTLMAFLKATKYPASLQFCLMTLGPAFLLLAFTESTRNSFTYFLITIGKVPMFYYILHLFAFVGIGFVAGFNTMNLGMVYFSFAAVVFVLFVFCDLYSKYKFSHPGKRWLKFI